MRFIVPIVTHNQCQAFMYILLVVAYCLTYVAVNFLTDVFVLGSEPEDQAVEDNAR